MPRSGPLPVDPIAEAKRQWIGARMDGCRCRHVGRHLDHPRAAAHARPHRRGPQALRACRSRGTRCCACSASPARDGCRWPAPSRACRCTPPASRTPSTGSCATASSCASRIRATAVPRCSCSRHAGRELVERATDALNTEVFADPGLSDDDTVELVADPRAVPQGRRRLHRPAAASRAALTCCLTPRDCIRSSRPWGQRAVSTSR